MHKISHISLNPSKTRSTNEVKIGQPNARQENLAGRMFFLMEIESRRPEDAQIINFIINTVTDHYYHNDKMLLREKLDTVQIDHIFEAALTKTNKELLEFLHQEKIKFNPNMLSAIIGVIYHDTVLFSSIGRAKALLFYKEKSGKSYKSADIIKQAGDDGDDFSTRKNPAKLFSSVISGTIPAGGYFVFTNEALPEFLSEKQLSEVITTLPPAGAAEQIKQTLLKINDFTAFSGIIIKNTIGLSNAELEREEKLTNSLKNIHSLEEKTEETFAPGGYFIFKKAWKNAKIAAQKILPQTKDSVGNADASIKDVVYFKKRSFLFLKHASAFLKSIAIFCSKFTKILIKNIQTARAKKQNAIQKSTTTDALNSQTQSETRPPRTLREKCAHIGNKLKRATIELSRMNGRKKAILAIAVASFVFIAINSMRVKDQENQVQLETEKQDLIALIEQKQNQIEANLLYGNEENAKKIMDELGGMINQVKDDGTVTQRDAILDKYTQQLDKLRNVAPLGDLKTVADFSANNTNADPFNLTLASGKVYAADSVSGVIYALNIADGATTTITDEKDSLSALKYPSVSSNGDIYYLNREGEVLKLAKNESISLMQIGVEADMSRVLSGEAYGLRLYYMDKNDNQIYRFTPAGKGFGKAEGWLKDKVDFKNVADMSIDGGVYILKGSGEVLKFFSGRQEAFALDSVEPALKFTTKIFASQLLDFIYILEPLEKRLLVFNKNGKFVTQYKNDDWGQLKDFAVDEKNKLIYLLNGAQLLSIGTVHS